jgi:predicted acyltransferase
MFISGAIIPFSILPKLGNGISIKQLVLKITRRMLILVALGIVYNNVLRDGFSEARYVSVLGQIGISWFFATLIVVFSGSLKKRLLWLAGILLGYAFIQLFIPVPGIGAGVLTPEGCINGYIDRNFLPGRLAYDNGLYDALGILSTTSSIGITLMGSFAGNLLRMDRFSGIRKVGLLACIGLCLIILGIILYPYYPAIKKCWTTTYSLLAGGTSFLLVALFYLVVDVWGYRKWLFFFQVIGMNSITIYLGIRFVNLKHTAEFLLGWISKPMGIHGSVLIILGVIIIEWLILYYLFKSKVFLKV